jgi:hypothetical protein
VPAAAVIPIPMAYIKFVVAKVFVVSTFAMFLLTLHHYFDQTVALQATFGRTIKHRIMNSVTVLR